MHSLKKYGFQKKQTWAPEFISHVISGKWLESSMCHASHLHSGADNTKWLILFWKWNILSKACRITSHTMKEFFFNIIVTSA